MKAFQRSLADRVSYVCAFILRGSQTHRDFDGCFEMGDGDELAGLIYARALKNPRLMEALPRYLTISSCKAAYEASKPA